MLLCMVGLALLGWGTLATPIQAQETDTLEAQPDEEIQPDEEAQRYENVDWHNVVLVDFKPGKTGRAMEIIDDHFTPASEQAGTQVPRMMELQTGPWDVMLIWTMEEGPSEMTWEISPEGLRFQEALVEVVGSEEDVEEIWDEYYSLVDRSTSYIGMAGRYGPSIAEQ
jgi:hypothetical protein